jgi:poly(3-hydroxybutyrate) depolymerase
MGLLVALQCSIAVQAGAADWEVRDAGGLRVHVYATAPVGGRRRPLLLALHGCAQTASVLRSRAGLERVAEARDVVVALPEVPSGGVLFGCWDYYGAQQARDRRHAAPLLAATAALSSDDALAIDPARVWISGLSSGAGQAAVMGCLAPEIFSGVALAAGPAVGTEASQASVVGTDAARAAEQCRSWAGARATAFARQSVALVAGTRDFVVAQGYLEVHREAWSRLIAPAGSLRRSELDAAGLPGHAPAGRLERWSDDTGPRLSVLRVEGMGHAWPAGTGPGPEIEFVASAGPDWARVVVDQLCEASGGCGGDPVDVDAGPRPDAGGEGDARPGSSIMDAGLTPEDASAPAAPEPAASGCRGTDTTRADDEGPGDAGALALLGLALLGRARRRRRPGDAQLPESRAAISACSGESSAASRAK